MVQPPTFDEVKRVVLEPLMTQTTGPSVDIAFALEPCSRLDSKIGGEPYAPEGFVYPTVRTGEAKGTLLRFLAQINFAQMPPLADFPDHGIVQFYISDNDIYGMDFDHYSSQNMFRTIYHENVTEKALQQPPSYGPARYFPISTEMRIHFTPSQTAINATDFRFEPLFVAAYNTAFPSTPITASFDLSDEVLTSLAEYGTGAGSRIGGYSHFIGTDPRETMPDKTVDLLQIDSEFLGEEHEISWGDCGVCHFFISPEELKKRDFSAVAYYWDCC